MHLEGKIKLRSNNRSICLLEVVTKVSLTIVRRGMVIEVVTKVSLTIVRRGMVIEVVTKASLTIVRRGHLFFANFFSNNNYYGYGA